MAIGAEVVTHAASATRSSRSTSSAALTMAGDGHRQQPGGLGQRLLAAAARRVARLDADRPHLPVLPLHRRRLDHAVAEVARAGDRSCAAARSSSRWDCSSRAIRVQRRAGGGSLACCSASPSATCSRPSSIGLTVAATGKRQARSSWRAIARRRSRSATGRVMMLVPPPGGIGGGSVRPKAISARGSIAR